VRARALVELRSELVAGARVPLNDLAGLVERARVDGADADHLGLCAAVVEVISDRRPLGSLDAEPVWRALPASPAR
jgi:hypothetical protein